MCLQLAEEVGLDIPQITKTVVENIRNKSGGGLPAAPGVSLEVTVNEVYINWLLLYRFYDIEY